MTVPLATTRVTVKRPASGDDPYETVTATTVAEHVRAHISAPRGGETLTGGQGEVVDAVLLCDIVDLSHYDRIEDETSDETWQVMWVRRRRGLGLDHMSAGLRSTSGASSG